MENLPVVNEEVADTIGRELLCEPRNEYVLRNLKELEEKNPEIAIFIKEFSVKAGDIINNRKTIRRTEAAQIMVIYSGLLVYKMLESQLQVDQLKQIFKTHT